MILKPHATKYPGYFQQYINQVEEAELLTAFDQQQISLEPLLNSISEEKAMHAYAPGKWTIKELLQHIIDTERIFAYRAVCIARGEKQHLPGFEEKDYAAASNANSRSWHSLVEEFLVNRKSIQLLFCGFPEEVFHREGTANNTLHSVANIGFILIGHFNHHKKVLLERYLP